MGEYWEDVIHNRKKPETRRPESQTLCPENRAMCGITAATDTPSRSPEHGICDAQLCEMRAREGSKTQMCCNVFCCFVPQDRCSTVDWGQEPMSMLCAMATIVAAVPRRLGS